MFICFHDTLKKVAQGIAAHTTERFALRPTCEVMQIRVYTVHHILRVVYFEESCIPTVAYPTLQFVKGACSDIGTCVPSMFSSSHGVLRTGEPPTHFAASVL